ncbi:TolC family outer membrane protein [Vibrio coralliirubri]|uniref:TolC family outer membrane protein n=1 Tax=Vibrio coralliirubri TaxID=1516159 RepID=UPI000637DFBB|nr:TolC family outer membrane protein [Vibrio coralliirubri]CDT73028.1 putative Type I secretion outer membrane protein, TolC [Vibrio coralliirubri]
MKLIYCSLLCSGLLLPLPSWAQSLEQAVSQTFATNPEIKSAFNEYISKRYLIDASTGAYKPSLDLDAGIGYEAINPASEIARGSTEMTRREASLTLNQLIWDGSKTLNDIDRVSADAESVRLQLLSNAQNTALDVVRVYIETIEGFEILALSESNLATHEKIYVDIKKRTDSGISSTADLTQIEARLAKAHSNLIAAENNLIDSQTTFIRLVGKAPQSLVFPRADKNFIPLTLELAQEQAYESHPVIKISQVDVESAKFQYKQSQSNYFPTLSFEAKQSWKEDAGGIKGSSDETTAMIRLNYNLYNGGRDSAKSSEMAYQLNKAKDLRERAYRSVKEELQLSWSALEMTSQQKVFLADHVDSASETVIAYEKQYLIGKRTLLDLLNTENELFESRKGYVEAKYSEQYAKYRVLTSTGNLLNALRVNLPNEWTDKVDY